MSKDKLINISSLTIEERQFIKDRKLKDKFFIGRFTKTETGYIVSDIRRSDFSKIKYKPQNKKAFTIKVNGLQNKISKNDSYYRFTWIMVMSSPNYVFEVDENEDIISISQKDIIKLLYEDIYDYPASASEKIVNTLDTLKNQLTASGKEVFIYELLQNANDYPQKVNGNKIPVDVEFHITDNYLVFQHSGDYFDAKNIAAICSINDKEKTDNTEAIGYKGIGFKTVFLDNNYVLLRTGDYQFRFDYDYTKDIEDTPWQILPIWTENKNIDEEVLNVIDNADQKYRVQIALRPTESDILHSGEQNYEELFSNVFETERVILFIPYVNSVSVYMDGEDEPSIIRIKENDKWCVSDPQKYVGDIPPELTLQLNNRIKKNDGKIPEKYYDFQKTSIGFACRREGNKLLPVDNSCLYCYLPAKKAKLGFAFLMNTDMIPTGPRDNVEPKEKINHAIARIAGEQFFIWIHDLLESGQYDFESIFSLVPDFEELEEKYDEDEDTLKFISEFRKGFEKALDEGVIIPVLDENENTILIPVNKVNYDVTGITCSGLMTDEELRTMTNWVDYFVHPNLRDTKNLCLKPNINRFMECYVAKGYTFDEKVLLKECENKEFSNWLSDINNNNKFLQFLVIKEYIKDFKDKNIFSTESDGILMAASRIYYDIDKYYNDITDFDDYLPRLSFSTRDFFAGNNKWMHIIDEIFKYFNCDYFVDKELCSIRNFHNTINRLKKPKTSYGFFNFLANNVGYSSEYKKFPIISFNSSIIENFNRVIYFYNNEGEILYNENWTDGSWLNMLSEEYSNKAKKYLKDNFCVQDFSIQKFVKDILLVDNKVKTYISNLGHEHIDFVHFCYVHKDCFNDSSLTNFSLWAYNKENVCCHILCEDVIFYKDELMDSYQNKMWIQNDWMYRLDEDYFENIEDIDSFKEFISKAFGVHRFTHESFYNLVVSKHSKDICNNVGGTETESDTKESIDILYYLGENYKLIFEENGNDRFIKLPLFRYDVWDKVTNRETEVYLYDNELKTLLEAKWTPEDFVFMLEEKYNVVFSKYPTLRKRLGINVYNFKSIKDILLENLDSLAENTEAKDDNVSFHRFLIQNKDNLTKSDYKKIQQLNIYVVDNKGTESSHSIDDSLYISNIYMEEGKGMESMVKKYDETAFFTSEIYLEENADEEEITSWRNYFIELGVNSDNKDIIFNSVLPNLAEIKDKNIVSLLAGYYDYFHADGEWNDALSKLRHLNVIVKGGDNEFRPLRNVLFNDCYKSEPFPYLVIENEIASFYHKSADVMRLLREIVDGSKNDKSNKFRSFKTVEDWKKEKLEWYLYLQNNNREKIKNIHTRFVWDLAKDYTTHYDLYTKVKVKEILLLGKDGLYHNAKDLTEGTSYNPRCNFEKYGVTLNYLSEAYLPFENPDPRDFRKLFTDMEVIYDFRYEHLSHMRNNYDFAVYFWTEYLTVYANRTHITAAGIRGSIEKELSNYATIPTSNGEKKEVRKPSQLYSQSLIQNGYVKNMVKAYEDKMPLESIFSTDEVSKILEGLEFSKTLSFEDCLECLLRTNKKTKRQDILSWLSSKHSIDHTLVNNYLNNENSTWHNGRGESVRLNELLVLDINEEKLRHLFGKNKNVLSQEYIESPIVFKSFCRIFNIHALTENDFELKPNVYLERTTEEMRQKLRLPLLIIAAVSDPNNWKLLYDSYCDKIDTLNFNRCSSITLSYKDILKDSSIQYYKNGNDLFFVKDWMGRRVFKDLIFDIVYYFDIDMDRNILEGIFEADENNQAQIIEEHVHYELGRDQLFIDTLKELNASIAEGIRKIEVEEENEDNSATFGTNTREESYEEDDKVDQNSYKQDEDDEGGHEHEDDEDDEDAHEHEDDENDEETHEHEDDEDDEDAHEHEDDEEHNPYMKSNEEKDNYHEDDVNNCYRDSHNESTNTSRYNKTTRQSKQDKGSNKSSNNDYSRNNEHNRERTSNHSHNWNSANGETNNMGSERSSHGTSQRRNRNNYMGYNPDETSKRPFNVGTQEPTTLETKEASQEEISRLSSLLGRAFDRDSIMDENYLVRMRFYNSVKDSIGEPNISERDFIKIGGKYMQTKNNKYVHRCSARGGILYVSPSIWNRLKHDNCIICMYYGKKANQFLYIRSQKELMDMIDKDAVVVQVTGNDKGSFINKVYDSQFPGMSGNIYTMIRTIKTSGDDFIFEENDISSRIDTEFDPDLV